MENPTDDMPRPAVETAAQRPGTRARTHAILFLAAAAIAALCIDFGSFHRLHNSDSIVPVLMSLFRWTPFYWDQDRFGMLVALLAVPFKNPLTNLLLQSAIDAFCGLAVFFLCARYVVRRDWLLIGAISASLFLLFNSGEARFLYLGLIQPYGVGMFLGLGGLLLLEAPKLSRVARLGLGFICLLAASWVDSAVIFVLLPMIFFRWLFERGAARGLDRKLILAAALVCASFAAMYACSGIVARSVNYGEWPYPPVSPWKWPAMWFQFGKVFWSNYLGQMWGISVASLLVLGALVRFASREKIRWLSPATANLAASAVVSFLLIGCMSHISNTSFDPRFGLPSMVLLQIGAVAWVLPPILAFLNSGGRRAVLAAGMCLFLVTPLILYGRPSMARVRSDLDATIGQYTPDIIQSGATHIIGDYWKVWPAVFHANMMLYEMGSDRRIWGVTVRSAPTEIFWSQIPPAKMRLAAIHGDSAIAYTLDEYSFPPVAQVGTFRDIVIFTPVANAEAQRN